MGLPGDEPEREPARAQCGVHRCAERMGLFLEGRAPGMAWICGSRPGQWGDKERILACPGRPAAGATDGPAGSADLWWGASAKLFSSAQGITALPGISVLVPYSSVYLLQQ